MIDGDCKRREKWIQVGGGWRLGGEAMVTMMYKHFR